jgi:MoxR-like ATPase
LDFALAVVAGTREHPSVRVGASSRAALSLLRWAQARALVMGRNYVVPDDVKLLAPSALGHRVVLAPGVTGSATAQAGALGVSVVRDVLASVPVPLRA